MSRPSLYHLVKDRLGEVKSVLSDHETLLINRRDFHINQISPVQATLASTGVQVSYPFRVLISFLDQFAIAIAGKDFNIILADPALAIAAYHIWLRAGGNRQRGKIYAPKGIPKFPPGRGIISELIDEFNESAESKPDSRPGADRLELFTFVLGNTKNSSQTLFAADQFFKVKHGILLLKDYSKIDAFDEREYLEGKQIFPSVTFEGHAFALKL